MKDPTSAGALSPVATPRAFRGIPPSALLAAIACAAIGMVTPNALLSVLAVACVLVSVALLWRRGAPGLLAFMALYQGLEFFAPILLANFNGVDIGDGFPERRLATGLGLVGTVFLALGMRLGARGIDDSIGGKILEPTQLLSLRALLIWYGLFLVISMFSEYILFLVPGTRQLLAPIVDLRWVFIILVIWLAGWDGRARTAAALLVLFEFAIGFGGFFSRFSEVLFIALIVVVWIASFRGRQVLTPMTVVFVATTVSALAFWQSIKPEYRSFLNQGTGHQVVLVAPLERLHFIWNRLVDLSGDDLVAGLESGLVRLSYIEFFAQGIEQYPDITPYQGGRLWGEAVLHIVTPRLLFPEKPAVHDSERVREVLGINVAGHEEGTSVTIGYFGESYVDFGPVFMFVPIFLTGWLVGWGYRWIIRMSPNALLGCAMAMSALLNTVSGSNVKMLGGLVTSLFITGAVAYFFGDSLWRRISTPLIDRRRAASR